MSKRAVGPLLLVVGGAAVVTGILRMYWPVRLHWGLGRQWALLPDPRGTFVGLAVFAVGAGMLWWAVTHPTNRLVAGVCLAAYGVGVPLVGFAFGDFQGWSYHQVGLLSWLSWTVAALWGGVLLGRWAANRRLLAGSCVSGLGLLGVLGLALAGATVVTDATEVPLYNDREVTQELGFAAETAFPTTLNAGTHLRDVNILPGSGPQPLRTWSGTPDPSATSAMPVAVDSPCVGLVGAAHDRQVYTWIGSREAPMQVSPQRVVPGEALRLRSVAPSYDPQAPASRVFAPGAELTITLCTLDGAGTVNSPATRAIAPEVTLGRTTADATGLFAASVAIPFDTPDPPEDVYPSVGQRVLVTGLAPDGLGLYASASVTVATRPDPMALDTPVHEVAVHTPAQGVTGLSHGGPLACDAKEPYYVAVPVDTLDLTDGGDDQVVEVRREEGWTRYIARLHGGLTVHVRRVGEPAFSPGATVDVRYVGPPSDYGAHLSEYTAQSIGEAAETVCALDTDLVEGLYGTVIFVIRLTAVGALAFGFVLGHGITSRRLARSHPPDVAPADGDQAPVPNSS